MSVLFGYISILTMVTMGTIEVFLPVVHAYHRHSHHEHNNIHIDHHQRNKSVPIQEPPTMSPSPMPFLRSNNNNNNRTTKSLKLTLVNSYPNGFDPLKQRASFDSHHNHHHQHHNKYHQELQPLHQQQQQQQQQQHQQHQQRRQHQHLQQQQYNHWHTNQERQQPIDFIDSSTSMSPPVSIKSPAETSGIFSIAMASASASVVGTASAIASVGTATVHSTASPRSLKDRLYAKHHAGRHVCIEHKTVNMPLANQQHQDAYLYDNLYPTVQATRPIYTGYKNVRHKSIDPPVLNCCPGWAQPTKYSQGCLKPICKISCKNGGKCIKPETCNCMPGFTGRYCEFDRNECKEDKPCDQFCYNTEGSYFCTCRNGFQLQSDRQSCKKIGGDDSALEARDLENDVDSDEVHLKIGNIEKFIENEKGFMKEIEKGMENTVNAVNHLRIRLDNVENRHEDLAYLKDKLNAQETQTRKLEYLVDLLYKCRTKSLIFCPLQS